MIVMRRPSEGYETAWRNRAQPKKKDRKGGDPLPPKNIFEWARRIRTLKRWDLRDIRKVRKNTPPEERWTIPQTSRFNKDIITHIRNYYDQECDVDLFSGENKRLELDAELMEHRNALLEMVASERHVHQDESGKLLAGRRQRRVPTQARENERIGEVDVNALRRQLLAETETVVQRTRSAYREEGVDDSSVQFIWIGTGTDSNGDREGVAEWRTTIKRIICAVVGLLLAVAFSLVHSFPVFQTQTTIHESFGYSQDLLYNELFQLRDLESHLNLCDGLNICSNAVLNLPSVEIIRKKIRDFSGNEDGYWHHRHSLRRGIDYTWQQECTKVDGQQCFRGVHDGFIFPSHISELFELGSYHIDQGGTHDQIHMEPHLLQNSAPSTVSLLESIFEERYSLKLKPIAYRLYSSPSIFPVLNNFDRSEVGSFVKRTIDWEKLEDEDKSYQELESMVHRDPCVLSCDMDYNSTFKYHSMVYLTSGTNHYLGGSTLLTSIDDRNIFSKYFDRRIQEGLLIEPEQGRILVNSGGQENQRCRLPVVRGIRAVFQIWWDDR